MLQSQALMSQLLKLWFWLCAPTNYTQCNNALHSCSMPSPQFSRIFRDLNTHGVAGKVEKEVNEKMRYLNDNSAAAQKRFLIDQSHSILSAALTITRREENATTGNSSECGSGSRAHESLSRCPFTCFALMACR